MKMKDIKGQKFGRLTAIKFSHIHKRLYYWIFKCDCGKKTVKRRGRVISGNTQSCGCFKIQRIKETNTTHGMTKTIFYRVWAGIKTRCYNKNDPGYKRYGGRGIKLLWKSFEQFRDDMYQSYLKHCKKFGKKNTLIERINNNGNYSKENCKWATVKEQQRNTRFNHLITYMGKTQCVSAWAEELEMSVHTLHVRLKRKWSIKRAIETPIHQSTKF